MTAVHQYHTKTTFLDSTWPSLFPSFGCYLCVPPHPVLLTVLSVRLSLLAAAFTQGKDEDPTQSRSQPAASLGCTQNLGQGDMFAQELRGHTPPARFNTVCQGSKTWKGTGYVAVKY